MFSDEKIEAQQEKINQLRRTILFMAKEINNAINHIEAGNESMAVLILKESTTDKRFNYK